MTGKVSLIIEIMNMQEKYSNIEDTQHVCNYEFEGIHNEQS